MLSILSRTDIVQPIDVLLDEVASCFHLGKITAFEFFERGYEDANIKLTTNIGIFVVKIFSKERTLSRIQDYIQGLVEFAKVGIPVPKLRAGTNKYLFSTVGKRGKSYICVMNYFEGRSLKEAKITENDILSLIPYVAKINQLTFSIQPSYDSWGVANLVKEYAKHKQYITPNDSLFISPVIRSFAAIDFSKFRHSIIHGDYQKEHVLKNNRGECCIIDLGCLDYNVSLFDLAIYLAQFCIDISPAHRLKELLRKAIKKYIDIIPLAPFELDQLLLCIKAHYVVYLVKTSLLTFGNNDKSEQTEYWLKFSRRGLYQFNNLFSL